MSHNPPNQRSEEECHNREAFHHGQEKGYKAGLAQAAKELKNCQKHHKGYRDGETSLAKENKHGWNAAMNYAVEIIETLEAEEQVPQNKEEA